MTAEKLILAGDIGGTKTKVALLSKKEGTLRAEVKGTFASGEYAGLEPVLKKFLDGRDVAIDCACFGVAGPIVDGQVETPNLPWVVNAEKLADMLGLESVALLNDLEAAAYGIFTLGSHELFRLNAGTERRPGNKVLIAAGTGLGEATMYDNGSEYHPSASEGGHGDFAPTDETQIDLLRYLIEKFGHVSYERVVSGPGLRNIYDFLKETGRSAEPDWLREELAAAADPSAAISRAALAGKSEICVQALHLFVSVYGAEAGNLALRGKAIGGVYIGGGIAPKILDKLKDGTFMRAFVDKGRYTELLSGIPVQVILNEEAPLQGAAYYAAFRFHG
ncbi:MAG: glucokinase [Deltaproteobacteria bacterium]|nr:glucokinase [Deltaproteobacteria bacterium]MDZ4345473.1 glucokinase [Candidatus Binatia bacterium]